MKTNDVENSIGDDPIFIINEGVEPEESLTTDEESINAKEEEDSSALDDIPVAVVAREEESQEESRHGNSVWSKLSAENLPQISLREILFGDYLIGTFLRGQLWFILLLVILGIAYISNRYDAQQEIIEEERLRHELIERKNYALTQYAELTKRTRQSALEQQLRSKGDSTLLSPTEPPFMIQKP